MRLSTTILVTAVGVFLMSHSPVTWADDAKLPAACTPTAYDSRIAARYLSDASGNLQCVQQDDPLTKRLTNWQDRVHETGATVPLRLRLVRAQMVEQRAPTKALGTAVVSDPMYATKVAVVQNALDEAIKEVDAILASRPDGPVDFSSYPALDVDYWKPGGLNPSEPHGVPLRYLQEKGCLVATPPAQCKALYSNAVHLADQIFVIDTIVSLLRSTERGQLLEDAKIRENHWHSYLYDTQFQFWWELALNYAVEKRCPVILRWDCIPPKTDEHGNELGFRDPPRNKLIFLHPDLAVEYLHREPAGQRFKPVIAFQWFGYQHWDWKGEGVTHLMGIALVSTVADTSVSNRVGTGLMLQWKRFALAITGRPKEIGVAINLNVVDWIGSVDPSWENKLKAPLTQ